MGIRNGKNSDLGLTSRIRNTVFIKWWTVAIQPVFQIRNDLNADPDPAI